MKTIVTFGIAEQRLRYAHWPDCHSAFRGIGFSEVGHPRKLERTGIKAGHRIAEPRSGIYGPHSDYVDCFSLSQSDATFTRDC
jgi:hypothetical protein